MANWPIVVTTLGASSITGLVGYASARWQGRVALEQTQMENEQLRMQHQEDHLRNRQNTYHEFLDNAAKFDRMRMTTLAIFGPQTPGVADDRQWEEEERNFQHLLNGVRLFGTADVRAAAERLNDLHSAITVEWWEALGRARERGQAAGDDLAGAFPEHRITQWKNALADLVDAMRRDVAPD